MLCARMTALVTCFLLLHSLTFGTTSAQAAAPDKRFQWVLVQNGIEQSDHVVTVSYDAVHIFSPKYGYHMVTSAPSWEVRCFRPKERIEWSTKLGAFNGHQLFSPFATGNANHTPLTFYEKGSFKGLKVVKYSHSNSPKSLAYGSDEIPVSTNTAVFLCRYYDVPEMKQVPLFHSIDRGYAPTKKTKGGQNWSFDEIAADVRQGTVLDLTTSSCKRVPFNMADFQYPRGFKRVSSAGQAAYSSGQKEMFTEFLDDVGLSTEQKGTKGSRAPSIQKSVGKP